MLRDPTTPFAVPFRGVFLPTLGHINRAITMPATGRTRKRICKEIEYNLWVPARHQSTRQWGQNCTLYRFSIWPSQYNLLQRSPTDATITIQHILGLGEFHLQWWQNVHTDGVVAQRRFLGRTSRRRGAGADIARARWDPLHRLRDRRCQA